MPRKTIPVVQKVQAAVLTPSVPQTLIIPRLSLDTRILGVDLLDNGQVDVPPEDVGWYVRGAKPGETGNAVLQGHVRNVDLNPGIFNRLSELQPGDDMYTVDASGNKFHFKVTAVDLVSAESFPIDKVYGATDKTGLNLITCAGSYDVAKHDYTQRTIIYSELAD